MKPRRQDLPGDEADTPLAMALNRPECSDGGQIADRSR